MGKELWQYFKEGKLKPAQQHVTELTCPEEELFEVSKDPYQLSNRVQDPKCAGVLKKMRVHLARWTKETGDSLPSDPTPDRDPRPGKSGKKILRISE